MRAPAEIYADLARLYAELATAHGVPVDAPAGRPDLVRKAIAARALDVSPVTLDRWAAAGMPFVDMATFRLYDLGACRSWAASRTKPGRPTRKAPPPEAPESWELPRTRERKAG